MFAVCVCVMLCCFVVVYVVSFRFALWWCVCCFVVFVVCCNVLCWCDVFVLVRLCVVFVCVFGFGVVCDFVLFELLLWFELI